MFGIETDIIGKIAGIVALAAFVPYIYSTLKGKTKPNRATWWIWTLVSFIIAGSYFDVGARETIWVAISYIVGPVIMAILSLKYGEGGWNKFDRFCVLGALAGFVLWILFDAPLIALLLTIFIDFVGFLPTYKKAYHNPWGESKLAWIIFVAADLLNVFAIETLAFGIVIYPVYMLIVEAPVLFLLFRKRKKNLRKNTSYKRL
ncbi:hypothetical protein KKF81_04145 [Candidatus Micrarchaeota archaeon]|nr:hypothetical protein [Candidatus Micrarchaeota archaeon]